MESGSSPSSDQGKIRIRPVMLLFSWLSRSYDLPDDLRAFGSEIFHEGSENHIGPVASIPPRTIRGRRE